MCYWKKKTHLSDGSPLQYFLRIKCRNSHSPLGIPIPPPQIKQNRERPLHAHRRSPLFHRAFDLKIAGRQYRWPVNQHVRPLGTHKIPREQRAGVGARGNQIRPAAEHNTGRAARNRAISRVEIAGETRREMERRIE